MGIKVSLQRLGWLEFASIADQRKSIPSFHSSSVGCAGCSFCSDIFEENPLKIANLPILWVIKGVLNSFRRRAGT